MGEEIGEKGELTMPLHQWLDEQIAAATFAVDKSASASAYPDADTSYGYDLGYLRALETVAQRLVDEECEQGMADEARGNVRRFGVA